MWSPALHSVRMAVASADCPVEPLGGYYQFLARFDPHRKVFVVDRYGAGLDAREFYNRLDVDRKIERLLETARPICPGAARISGAAVSPVPGSARDCK